MKLKRRPRLPIRLLGALLCLLAIPALRAQNATTVLVAPEPEYVTYNEVVSTAVLVQDTNTNAALANVPITVQVDGGAAVQGTTNAVGFAFVNLGQLPIGSHTLLATFAGNSTDASSTGTANVTVNDAPFLFVGTQGTTLFVDGYVFAVQGVAVDTEDNLYISDSALNDVQEEDIHGTRRTLPFTGLSGPIGLALDSAGNLYVSDSGNNRILKLTPAGVQSVVAVAGLKNATYLAYDRGNDLLYIADPGNGRVVRLTVATGAQADAITGLTALRGISVDNEGNLLLADRFAGFLSVDLQGYQTPIFAAVDEPGGIAGGLQGDVIVSDVGRNTVIKVDNGGNQVQINDAGNPVVGMATDSEGRVFLALGGRVDVAAPGSGRTSDEVVGDDSNYNSYNSVIFQTPQAAQTITISATPAGTFDLFEPVTCSGIAGGCSGIIRFRPQVPGLNTGTLSAAQGGTAGILPVWGNGIGGEASFLPGVLSQVSSGVAAIGGVAFDTAGNRYVSDKTNNAVYKVTAAGVSTKLPFTGLSGPTQLATDAAGGVYVLDTGSGTIIHLDSAGHQSVAYGSVQESVNPVVAFALDGDTNLILAGPQVQDEANPRARRQQHATSRGAKPPAHPRSAQDAGGDYAVVRQQRDDAVDFLAYYENGTEFTNTLGPVASVAVDAYGAVYALETAGNVWRYGTDGSTTELATGLSNSIALGTDAAQEVYVASSTTAQITTLQPSGKQGTFTVNGVYSPASLAVDGYGDLLIGDGGDKQLVFADRTQQDYVYGNVNVGSSDTLHASVSNIGNQPFTVAFLPGNDVFTEASSDGACQTGQTTPESLTPGTGCALAYTFTPPSAGPFTYASALGISPDTLSSTPGKGAMTFDGTGVGAAAPATATLTPATAAFGSVTVGSSMTTVLTLTNTGTTALAITGTAPPTGVFQVTATTCTASLAAAASCTYTVTFAPTAAGAQTGSFAVTDAAGTQTSTLTGTGAAAPAAQAALTPATADFGSVTVGSTGTAQTFTLANAGNAALTISSVTVGGANAASFKLGANTCGASLAAGASCTIAVSFAPTAVASDTAALSVIDAVGTQSSTLTGIGAAAPAPKASLTPATASFGSVVSGMTGTAQTFTLTNAGNAALTISSVSLAGTNAAAFILGTNACGSSLAAGASCTMAVAFAPTALGAATATLTVVDAVGTQTSALTGTGLAPPVPPDFTLTATPATQSTYRGRSVSYTVLVASVDPTNPFTDAVALTATGLPANASATFSPAALTPGTTQATSTLTVTVAPLSAALSSGPLNQQQTPDRRSTFAAAMASLMFLFGLRRWRRKTPTLPAALLLLAFGVVATTLTGCGSNGNGFAVPTSTSTITITGTSASTSHSATVKLTIQ